MNKRTVIWVLYVACLVLITGKAASQDIYTVEAVDRIIAGAADQYRGMVASIPDMARYPRTTLEDGSLRLVDPGDWTSGFFPGSLWLLYEYTRSSFWLDQAAGRTAGIEDQKFNTGTHDLGFMLGCSFGNGYRLTEDPGYKNILVQAATSLASRFDADVGCIRSWDFGFWEFPVIVDNMMNLELLFSATRFSGDSTYWKKAVSHADVTMKNHFREDFSSYHVVDYNKTTGDTIAKYTHQGYSKESAWARGQSWGLYGYTVCYRFTKDPRYLAFAENIARFLINHERLPDDLVPYWDFDAPGIPNEPRDVAAATIMCAALFELSRYSEEYGDTFLNVAMDQISSFASENYTAAPDSNNHFILMHGTGNYPANKEVDKPLNYADYYYLEALTRYRRHLNTPPDADFQYVQTDSVTESKVEFDASASSDSDNDSLTFLWDFGDGSRQFSPGAIFSHVYEQPGEYEVTLYVEDHWDGSDSLVRLIAVAPLVALGQRNADDMEVFPNPASDRFHIRLPDAYREKRAYLVNAAGQKFPVELDTRTTWIPSEQWQSGLFLLVIPGPGQEVIRKKIIILNGDSP
ncbi:MAG: PKD domain-containing protein [Bacteroidales bacterium]